MDMTPAILIFVPILWPIVRSFGMSAIHFGVMMVFNLCVGSMTPPVGAVLFVACGISKLRIEQVVRTLIPYFAILIGALMLVTYIPAISMLIPSLMGLV